ncbi:glutathione S-transferase family protein [uncultured Tateyamaria sp.]|uniref:glutathione S-transferase family protein n=1 Tax=uncultured Tateyamaria sp. TaxID=455651 RepID=UPI00263627B8|nr:glutathione S-transferase family protein [uncultured Tateyamaria sp.]
MLTIHGRATSSNVQAVMWAVAELGLAHERRDVGGAFGGTDTDAFRAMNPMGRVPVLQDGDVTMFESQAILRYVAARYGTGAFWPEGAVARAPVDQWMEWAKTAVAPAVVYKVFWQLVRTAKADRDHATLAEGVAEAKALMQVAEAQIAQHGWLAGPEMSLADIAFGTSLYRYFTLPFERADYPHLRRYYDQLCDRPAYAEHVMVSFEPLRVAGA